METLDGIRSQLSELVEYAFREGYEACRDDAVKSMRECGFTSPEEAYQKGLDDAWECLKWIARNRDIAEKLFCASTYDVLMDVSPSEAIAKIKAYEEQKKAEQEDFKVGDEIVSGSAHAHAVITYITSCNEWDGFAINDCDACEPGQCYTCMHGFDGWKKTGRHFDLIAEVLKRLQEGEDADSN